MKAFHKLMELNLAGWSEVFLGLKKGWIGKNDVADYASNILSSGVDDYNENVAILAGADSMTDYEVEELVLPLLDGVDHCAFDSWRLAALEELNDSELSDEDKIQKLQELYGEFDYPEDMEPCSIYSEISIDPLEAMKLVIKTLKTKKKPGY